MWVGRAESIRIPFRSRRKRLRSVKPKRISGNMRERYTKAQKIASVIMPVAAVIIAVTYFLALKYDFDFSIGHFRSNSVPFIIMVAVSAASAVASALFALLAKKCVSVDGEERTSVVSLFASILAAVICIGLVIFEIRDGNALKIVSAVLLLPAGAALVLSGLDKKNRFARLRTVAYIAGAVSVIIISYVNYFDFSTPMDGAVRNITIILQSSVLFFFLSEARLSFGKETGLITSRFYVFTAMILSSLTLGYSAGAAVFRIVCNNPSDPNTGLMRLVLYFSVAVIGLTQSVFFSGIAGDPLPPEPKEDRKKKSSNVWD